MKTTSSSQTLFVIPTSLAKNYPSFLKSLKQFQKEPN